MCVDLSLDFTPLLLYDGTYPLYNTIPVGVARAWSKV